MDDLDIIPVYRVLHSLRTEITNNLSNVLQALASNNFDEAEQTLTETRRQVLVLQTLMEE